MEQNNCEHRNVRWETLKYLREPGHVFLTREGVGGLGVAALYRVREKGTCKDCGKVTTREQLGMGRFYPLHAMPPVLDNVLRAAGPLVEALHDFCVDADKKSGLDVDMGYDDRT